MQMHGKFQGFPINSAFFGLVSYNDPLYGLEGTIDLSEPRCAFTRWTTCSSTWFLSPDTIVKPSKNGPNQENMTS